jgi:hypothetical protein
MIRILLLVCLTCLAQQRGYAEQKSPLLFESDAILELAMPVDFETLCRPSQDPDCDFVAFPLEYRADDGNWQALSVELRRRDGWRAQHTNCRIPTLFIRFPPESAQGTPFEGLSTLALTSHCGKGIVVEGGRSIELPSDFEPYVINEYLGYRLYNVLTEASLRVRLARIRYSDPDNPRLSITRDAFFAEHFDSLARRNGAELVPEGQFDATRLDAEAAARLALFQYMIGNTDWSIERQDNVVILQMEDGHQVPVLYDLDQSGLVNPHYAKPAAGLPIRTVRQRFFQGYCHPDFDWDALFGLFIGSESEIKTVLSRVPGLRRGDRRIAGVYLDEFFDTLVRLEDRERLIVNGCQSWPPGA